jgi:hypothetical protein
MTLLMDLDINVTPLDDASAQAQWLGCGSITNTPGGYSEVYFRAEENTADEDRTARFIVSYDGCESVMTVTQKARNAAIEFEDPLVGKVMVDAFDSDADGKVSYAEASRLTIDDAAKIDFSGLDIRSFDELRYFTEFWHLQSPSFAGSKIESIRFPYRLSGLGDGMFENCTELKEVELMCIGVGNRTFRGCTAIRSIEAESGAFPHTAFLHKENERDYNSPFKFSKSIVCRCLWKYISHMFLNFIDIEMLETLISTQVEQNHYGYDLSRGHLRVAMILAFGLVTLSCKTICLDKSVIKFAKVIGHTENFSNFVS